MHKHQYFDSGFGSGIKTDSILTPAVMYKVRLAVPMALYVLFYCVSFLLIENWNRVVGKNDLVFHLGDFAFGGAEVWNRFLDQLNGRIVLVVGNHDIYHLRAEMLERFEQVAFELYVVIDNQPIFLNHHPFLSYGDSHGKVWQLFGHVHTRGNGQGKEKDKQRLPLLMATQYDVGVDHNNYTPVSFERVKEIINAQQNNY